jgi:hypothetical protein
MSFCKAKGSRFSTCSMALKLRKPRCHNAVAYVTARLLVSSTRNHSNSVSESNLAGSSLPARTEKPVVYITALHTT